MKRTLQLLRNILPLLILLAGLSAVAQEQHNALLVKADTLFKKKQYTQSFELYEDLFKQHKHSPAMLLKMAYIQEGMGHVSSTLYYLNLYYKITKDEMAEHKIEELANNNSLEGYGVSPSGRFFTFLEDHYLLIAGAFGAASILLMTFAWAQKRKRQSPLMSFAFGTVALLLLLLHVNFSTAPEQAIIANASTYIMSGPSAGAPVTKIVSAGHQVTVLGRNDVWARIKWENKEAWVKSRELLTVKL